MIVGEGHTRGEIIQAERPGMKLCSPTYSLTSQPPANGLARTIPASVMLREPERLEGDFPEDPDRGDTGLIYRIVESGIAPLDRRRKVAQSLGRPLLVPPPDSDADDG